MTNPLLEAEQCRNLGDVRRLMASRNYPPRNLIEDVLDWNIGPEGYFRQQQDTFIYFIADENALYLKVGFSKNPEERIKALQTGNPLKLILLLKLYADQLVERRLHGYLKEYRMLNEWYPLDGEHGWKVQGVMKNICLSYFCGMDTHAHDYIYGPNAILDGRNTLDFSSPQGSVI